MGGVIRKFPYTPKGKKAAKELLTTMKAKMDKKKVAGKMMTRGLRATSHSL